jgi:hypothetical protein
MSHAQKSSTAAPERHNRAMTRSLDAATALRVGGWDPRFTRVIFIAEDGDVGIAMLDADTDFNIDEFNRDADGAWRGANSGSSNADSGVGISGEAAYAYGRSAPGTVVAVEHHGRSHQVVTDDSGWWVYLGHYVENGREDCPRPKI